MALMQPYFLPYLGYWQLLDSADEFIVYDTVPAPRGGWVNRNRIRLANQVRWLTVPMAHAPLATPIREREVRLDARSRNHLLGQVDAAYRGARFHREGLGLLSDVLTLDAPGLGDFLQRSLRLMADCLGITTPMPRASHLPGPAEGDAQARVIDLCRARGATEYLNLSGGAGLYSPQEFRRHGIELRLRMPSSLDSDDQRLSILDLVMRRSTQEIRDLIDQVRWAPPAPGQRE